MKPFWNLLPLCVVVCIAPSPTRAAESSATGTNAHALKTYRNPLMRKREIADPDVIRVDGKYFLYQTSDTRGYQAFVSDDLVHWELKGRVFEDPRGSDWVSEVFHNRNDDGKFYFVPHRQLAGREAGSGT